MVDRLKLRLKMAAAKWISWELGSVFWISVAQLLICWSFLLALYNLLAIRYYKPCAKIASRSDDVIEPSFCWFCLAISNLAIHENLVCFIFSALIC